MNAETPVMSLNRHRTDSANDLPYKIHAPSATKLTAILLAGVVCYAVGKAVLIEDQAPLLLPLVTAALSAAFLFFFGKRRTPISTFMRVGFYVAMFAYFLSYPILSPNSLDPDIKPEVHQLVGFALLLTVLGFEASYWFKLSSRKSRKYATTRFDLSANQQKWILMSMCLGLALRFLSVWDYAESANVSILSVLLTMRGHVEGAPDTVVTQLGYLTYISDAGVFVSATGALLLLGLAKRIAKPFEILSWLALVLCAVAGFIGGSRALFLYSFTPLATACWIRLSRLRIGWTSRWLSVAAAASVVIVVWGAMSAMRGDDLRNYEGGWEEMAPTLYTQGAFDIYSAMAKIVQVFPDEVPFEHGRSLVPLALGWVPRPLWREKPYPFSLYANTINGETLEIRSASIAVGLPGEGYGNFGLLGAVIWGVMLGFASRWGDDRIARISDGNPLRLQLAAVGAVWTAMIVRGGVPEMFYMGLIIIAFPAILSWRFARSSRATRSRDVVTSDWFGRSLSTGHTEIPSLSADESVYSTRETSAPRG